MPGFPVRKTHAEKIDEMKFSQHNPPDEHLVHAFNTVKDGGFTHPERMARETMAPKRKPRMI